MTLSRACKVISSDDVTLPEYTLCLFSDIRFLDEEDFRKSIVVYCVHSNVPFDSGVSILTPETCKSPPFDAQ